MTRRKTRYWAATGFAAVALAATGFANLVGVPAVIEGLKHLGYPAYLGTMLGIAKLLGVLAIVTPGHPRLKEWAYAGFWFLLTGAAIAHAVSGDSLAHVMVPLVLLVVVMASRALQPGQDADGVRAPDRRAA